MGRLTRALALLGLLASLAMGIAPVASAASWASFGTPTARSTFGTGVEFDQPVTIDKRVARVELLLTVADAIGPTVIQVAPPSTTGPTVLTHVLDTSGSGHLFPNTLIVARWRLVGTDDTDIQLGPVADVTYADERFKWQTQSGPVVRVHWYQGTADFGRRALKVGEDGVRKAADLLGVTETKPVDFYVYADQSAFYDALGPGTRENVGGEQIPGLRTLFALIPPSQINDPWVGIVIPHELTHLVFDTAVSNPYHQPPRWLNEGLAVYESQGYVASDRGLMADAVSSDSLIPLSGLAGQFPTSADAFFLAYAESVSAIDFMIRTYGTDALVAVIRSYRDGRTDDEAFKQGLGIDTTAFGQAWLADLGARAPTRYGPQPAPAGPLPSAWSSGGPATAPTASTNGGAITASGGPASPVAPASSGPSGGSDQALAILAVVGVGLVLVVLVAASRRRRRPADGSGQ